MKWIRKFQTDTVISYTFDNGGLQYFVKNDKNPLTLLFFKNKEQFIKVKEETKRGYSSMERLNVDWNTRTRKLQKELNIIHF